MLALIGPPPVILNWYGDVPPVPVAVIAVGSTFLSAIIADATGVAFTSLGIAVTGASDFGATGAGAAVY